jgi:ribosomal protein L34E
MRLVQHIFDCGRPPQACRSGRRQQQHQPGFVARAIEIVLKLVDVILCKRCERGLTGWRSFRQPEIPDDQKRSNDPNQPKRVFDSSRWHVLPSKQACDDLWEKDHKKDD